MLSYGLVALGGAIGSMLRFALGNLGAALLGSSFPWATIGINVVGSALIGFVSAGSVANGILPNSSALRALVMVGVCGGFTTFSSFSLQTLDLLRDARPLAACANVLLSVGLCLGGVAAGSFGASHLVLRRIATQADNAFRAGATVLAVLDRLDGANAILDGSARLLALSGGGGRVQVLAVRPADLADVARTREEGARVDALRLRFEAWRGRAAVRADWADPAGEAAANVIARGRTADLVVIGGPGANGGETRHEVIHAALFGTGKPVLVVPPDPANGQTPGRVVAIAWNGDRPVRAAVRTAVPVLRAAGRVVLLSDDDRLAPPSVPGVSFERSGLPDGDRPVGARILDAAHAAGADLLLIGAYRHGALRERVFGGATRHVLDHADLPLLLRH